MKITSIAIVFLIIACFAIYRTVIQIKKEDIGLRSGMIWIAIWGSICVLGIFPDVLNVAMGMVQMRNRMFFILIIAVFILFALVFNQATQLDKMDRNIRRLVREVALLNYKLENKDKDEGSRHE